MPPITLVLFGALGIFFVFLAVIMVRVWRMEKRMKVFFEGRNAKSLEDITVLLRKETMETRKTAHMLSEQVKNIDARLQRSIQKVGMVRFNPFRNAGGDQSFSVALLDEARNGVVISSLYSRDGVRIYGKPVSAGASSYTLSAEEEQVIQMAIKES